MPALDEETFTLFVILPSQSVCTLRRLASGITVTDLKCHLELMAGYPAHVYRLAYPDGEMLADDKCLLIKKTVDDGYVLRVVVDAEWNSLCQTVLQDNVEHVYSEVCHVGIASGEHAHRASTALFMASYRGQFRMCGMLLSVGTDVNWKTPYGRTAVHAAVSADCVCILELLVAKGAVTDTRDVLEVNPSQTATAHGSTLCNKKLRLMQLNLRGKSAHARVSESMVSQPPRIPSEPIRRSQNLPAETWRRPTTVHVSFPGVGDSSRVRLDKPNNATNGGTGMSHYNECKHSSSSGFFAPNMHETYLERAKNFSRGHNKRQLPHSEDASNVLFGKQLTILRSKRDLKFGSDDALNSSRSQTPGSYEENVTPSCNNVQRSSLSGISRGQQGSARYSGRESSLSTNNQGSGKKSPKYVRFAAKERSWISLPKSHSNLSSQSIKRKIHLIAGGTKVRVPPPTAYKYGDSHRDWLKKKALSEQKLESDSSSSDDDNDKENKEAFKNWLENKKHPPESKRHVTGNRPIPGLITVGSTDVGSAAEPDPTFNIRAYREWLVRRKQHGAKSHRMRTMQDFMAQKRKLEEKRQQLLISTVSYDEWLEHTSQKQALIRRILGADMERLKEIEEKELRKREKVEGTTVQAHHQGHQHVTIATDNRSLDLTDKGTLRKQYMQYGSSVHRQEPSVKIRN